MRKTRVDYIVLIREANAHSFGGRTLLRIAALLFTTPATPRTSLFLLIPWPFFRTRLAAALFLLLSWLVPYADFFADRSQMRILEICTSIWGWLEGSGVERPLS